MLKSAQATVSTSLLPHYSDEGLEGSKLEGSAPPINVQGDALEGEGVAPVPLHETEDWPDAVGTLSAF